VVTKDTHNGETFFVILTNPYAYLNGLRIYRSADFKISLPVYWADTQKRGVWHLLPTDNFSLDDVCTVATEKHVDFSNM